MDLYPWVVFVHVAAAFLFVLGHGASMWTSTRSGANVTRHGSAPCLELSSRSLGLVYGSLLTLLIAGIAAGVMGGWFGQGWIWAAIVVLVAIIVLMYALGDALLRSGSRGRRAARVPDTQGRAGADPGVSRGARGTP